MTTLRGKIAGLTRWGLHGLLQSMEHHDEGRFVLRSEVLAAVEEWERFAEHAQSKLARDHAVAQARLERQAVEAEMRPATEGPPFDAGGNS